MAEMKNLAKETAIYGLSSIFGKFLNWGLVPLYTYVLASSAEYGVITNLYAWTALLLVILTYGMETGFFRFMNKKEGDGMAVYSTSLFCIASTSLLFMLLCVALRQPIADLLGYNLHSEYIAIMCVIVALDAFSAIPFAYLRFQNSAFRFAGLKLVAIFVNIFFNLFFLVACPKLQEVAPSLIDWFYNPAYGVG